MLKKIISGGQTGADRATLDVAIQFNIPHGGWIPKGSKVGDSRLPDKYHFQEMPTSSYQTTTEKNVFDSDGTLTFSRGAPSGEIKYIRMIALQHKKHFLLINFNKTTTYDASSLILSWIRLQNIETLFVSGPKASEDEKIYGDVFRVLEVAYLINQVNGFKSAKPKQVATAVSSEPPTTIDEAIDRLTAELSLRDKAAISKMTQDNLDTLQESLGVYIWNEFGFWSGNQALLDSCQNYAPEQLLSRDRAVKVIIRELWKTLRQTHRLRPVK